MYRVSKSLLAVISLHTIISSKYHWNIAPSRLEWIDIGIAIRSIYWIRRIRQNVLYVEAMQPAMCWSSFFFQLYEMIENDEVDRTQLEEDIKTFLHMEM